MAYPADRLRVLPLFGGADCNGNDYLVEKSASTVDLQGERVVSIPVTPPASLLRTAGLLLVLSPTWAQPLSCNLQQYQASAGPLATQEGGALAVRWRGDAGTELR